MVRSRSEKEKVAFEKSERAKAEARLMEINTQLEERLKARTEDLRKTGQKLVEAQRGANQTKLQLEDKNKQITKFEYKENQHIKMQEEFQHREKELSKRLLRLSVQEDVIKQREEYRIDQLRQWLKGEKQTESLSEVDADINQTAALERMEVGFDVVFKKRQDKFDASLREYDRRLDEKRSQYNSLNRDLAKLEDLVKLEKDRKAQADSSRSNQLTSLLIQLPSDDLQGILQAEPQLISKMSSAVKAFENR